MLKSINFCYYHLSYFQISEVTTVVIYLPVRTNIGGGFAIDALSSLYRTTFIVEPTITLAPQPLIASYAGDRHIDNEPCMENQILGNANNVTMLPASEPQ